MKKILLIIALTLSSTYLIANITTNHTHDKTLNSAVIDHSGRTDVYGCHRNRKTGGYHCH